jgi:hypothetical protein
MAEDSDPRGSAATASGAPGCGPMAPLPSDIEITDQYTPEQIVAMVQDGCQSEHSGVFFFRHQDTLYLRCIEGG